MNSKRRAELQRKLTLNAVPRPPAGLAERIKSDIPKYLQPEVERERFSRSIAFHLRVAASILLVVASVFVAFEVLTPTQSPVMHSKAVAPQMRPTAMPMPQSAAEGITHTVAREEEVQVEVAQAAPAPQHPRRMVRDSSAVSAGSAAELGTAPEPQERIAQAEVAMAPPPSPPPPPVAAPAAPAAQSLVREAYADTLAFESPTAFGISIDPEVFRRIKNTIESGGRPDASAVDTDAVVNYFAGGPARPVRRDVNLEVEASPAPVEMEGDHAVLRFSVDTVKANVSPGATVPPIARDARIEVEVNPDVVASIHRIGREAIAPQSTLLRNVSVTGLYALELRPGIRSNQKIATVRLHFTSILTGRQQVITRIVHGHDLARDWSRSSRRHRLASLGAMWAEALKGTGGGTEVARRAEELATQNPRDERARELAKAATATGGS